MEEVWKSCVSVGVRVPDGRYKYEVSNLGRVRSIAYTAETGLDVKEKLLKISGDGLIHVVIDKRSRGFLVSRLVAEAFVPNPDGYSTVGYKDGDCSNWAVDNLEWRKNASSSCYGRCLYKKNPSGEIVAEYASVALAARETGYAESAIRACLRDQSRTTAGYYWEYVTEPVSRPVSRAKRRSLSPEDVSTFGAIETRQYTATGKLVKVWPSAKVAAITLGFNPASVSSACARKQKLKGYLWRKATDDEFAEANGLSVKSSPKVRQYSLDGEFIAEYSTPIEASYATDISNSFISAACRGNTPGKKAGGFLWRYSDNDELYKG